PGAFLAVHEDDRGRARVAFVMNPTASDLDVRVSLAGVNALVDAVGEGRIARAGGAFEVPVTSRTVRMMVIDRAGH
ncbi:MAG: hypothetical protein ACRDYC_10560, partial [Acidimicrobiales bacterium]